MPVFTFMSMKRRGAIKRRKPVDNDSRDSYLNDLHGESAGRLISDYVIIS